MPPKCNRCGEFMTTQPHDCRVEREERIGELKTQLQQRGCGVSVTEGPGQSWSVAVWRPAIDRVYQAPDAETALRNALQGVRDA